MQFQIFNCVKNGAHTGVLVGGGKQAHSIIRSSKERRMGACQFQKDTLSNLINSALTRPVPVDVMSFLRSPDLEH